MLSMLGKTFSRQYFEIILSFFLFFFFCFSENGVSYFMQIAISGDSWHEMSISWTNSWLKKRHLIMSYDDSVPIISFCRSSRDRCCQLLCLSPMVVFPQLLHFPALFLGNCVLPSGIHQCRLWQRHNGTGWLLNTHWCHIGKYLFSPVCS